MEMKDTRIFSPWSSTTTTNLSIGQVSLSGHKGVVVFCVGPEALHSSFDDD